MKVPVCLLSCSFKSTGTLIFIFVITGTGALATAFLKNKKEVWNLSPCLMLSMIFEENYFCSGCKIMVGYQTCPTNLSTSDRKTISFS